MPPLAQRIAKLTAPITGVDHSLPLGERVKGLMQTAKDTITGLPAAAVKVAKDDAAMAVHETGKGLGIIGDAVDKIYGAPGRIATANNPAVPQGFSDQVHQALQQSGVHPAIATAGGLAALIAEPMALPAKGAKAAKAAEEIFYHGADPETIAKIRAGGFIGSHDFPGSGMVSLTPVRAEAEHYAHLTEKAGSVLPVSVKGKNVKVYDSLEDYTKAIEAAPGATSGEKEAALNKAYDMVRVKMPNGEADAVFANPAHVQIHEGVSDYMKKLGGFLGAGAVATGGDGEEDNRGLIDKLTGTSHYDRSKALVKDRYPFTPEMRKIVDTVPLETGKTDKPGTYGEYIARRGPVSEFFGKLLNPVLSPLAPDLLEKITGEKVINQSAEDKLGTAHEFLHAAYKRSPVDQKTFDTAWDAAKKADNDGVLAYIDHNLETSKEYKGISPADKNNERYAFLGSMNGVNGLASLPKELRPFYSKVFKAEKDGEPDNLVSAIANNETGVITARKKDPYAFFQKSGSKALGDALGKYQVTEGELKSYAKQFLGRDVTRKEYLTSPEIQDEYVKNKVKFLKQEGLTDAQILAVHRYGISGYGDEGALEKKVTRAQPYVAKGLKFLKESTDDSSGG